MNAYKIDTLLRTPDSFLGIEVTATGTLVSQTQGQFWLISKEDDLTSWEAILLAHPTIAELLFETVPYLGGGYAYFHQASATGLLLRSDSLSPALKLCNITFLEIRAPDKTYRLI